MPFSTRSRMSIVLSLVTILAIVSGFVVAGIVRGASASVHAAGNPYSASQGSINAITRADLSKLPASKGVPASTNSDPSHGTVKRSTHRAASCNLNNPLKQAVVYQIDTTDNHNPGCPCFGDQPLFGLDQFNFYVSTNEFSILGPQFNGAQIYALDKSALVHMTKVKFVHFGNLNIGGAIAASVQPAINHGNVDAEYFLNSLDPNGTFDNRIGVWAMTGRDKVAKGGMPDLSSIVITSETYGLPPSAESPHNELLNTDDDRMQQVQFINGQLWSSLTTAITIPGDQQTRSAAAWFEIQPHLKGNVIGGAQVTNQGYVD